MNYTYHYVGGQLRYETRENEKFYYFYDASGVISGFRYVNANGTAALYYTLTNAQGDVVAIYDQNGALVGSYEYDAWGKVVKMTDGSGSVVDEDNTTEIVSINAIRYRGYYYDEETKFYYLQSRYYNPEVGRFLNADGMLNGNGDILGYNMFAYCGNNPVNYSDPSGCGKFWEWIKKNFGFESTASYTEKTKGYGWGDKFLLQYKSGKITKATTTETSDAPVVYFVNVDNSETISLGSRSDFISASVNLGFSGWGASTSINSDVFSGEFELTTSPVFTTVTVVKYAKFSDNCMEGTYESFQINNITLGAIAIVSVYCPQVFGAFVSAYATAVGSGAVPLPA